MRSSFVYKNSRNHFHISSVFCPLNVDDDVDARSTRTSKLIAQENSQAVERFSLTAQAVKARRAGIKDDEREWLQLDVG